MHNATYKGRLYALPFSGDASVLFYNTDLFKAAGIAQAPRTWTEIEADARKVVKTGGGRYRYYFLGRLRRLRSLHVHAARVGVRRAHPDGAARPPAPDADEQPPARRRARVLPPHGGRAPRAAAGGQRRGRFAVHAVRERKVAMFSTGSFGVSTFRQDAPHLHYVVTPIPGEHGGSSSFAGGDEIAVTRSSKHQAAAWEFIRWGRSAPVHKKYFGDQGVIPVRRDVADRSYAPRSPAFRALTHALFTGRVVYSVQENAPASASAAPTRSSSSCSAR